MVLDLRLRILHIGDKLLSKHTLLKIVISVRVYFFLKAAVFLILGNTKLTKVCQADRCSGLRTSLQAL